MKPALVPLLSLLPVLLCAAGLYWHRRRRPQSDDRAALREGLREVLRAVPARPPLLTMASSSALSLVVEARLLAGLPQRALDEIEHELHGRAHDAAGCVAMAKALFYCGLLDEARTALRWAQRLGADDAEYDYLRARLHAPDAEALRLALRACRREPAYGEALYLCARLARTLGFATEAERLLRAIAPLMARSVERLAYRRDLEDLVTEPRHWRRPPPRHAEAASATMGL